MTETEKLSYALGMNVYGNLAELPVKIDFKIFRQAIDDALTGNPLLEQKEYARKMMEFQTLVQDAGKKALRDAVEANRAAGKKFLADNAQKKGVVVTASGDSARPVARPEAAVSSLAPAGLTAETQ